jgi:2-polyprenyl-3-methyl-5-hydroxy-6-metoxy-1,4-benzoquinol methylase
MMLNSRWDHQPEAYAQERDCWLNRRRALFIENYLQRFSRGARILEVGSGTGGLLVRLARARPDLEFLGVEPQESYVAYARKGAEGLSNLRFETGKAESFGGSETIRFNGVLSNDVLHHVSDLGAVVGRVSTHCAPDAWWLAIEPNFLNPYVLMGQSFKAGEKNFRPRAFARLASSQGWTLESRQYLFLIPPFVKEPSSTFMKLEAAFEGCPPIAGGVALSLCRRED